MKRLLLYALILAVMLMIPVEYADIAQLRPIEVIAIYKKGSAVVLQTDTEDIGQGNSVEAALANMRSSTPAIIYLDTAEFLLIGESAEEEVEALRGELKASVKLCGVDESVDLKNAAQYLSVHGMLPKLRDWHIGNELPVLHSDNDRLKISEYSKKPLDKGE